MAEYLFERVTILLEIHLHPFLAYMIDGRKGILMLTCYLLQEIMSCIFSVPRFNVRTSFRAENPQTSKNIHTSGKLQPKSVHRYYTLATPNSVQDLAHLLTKSYPSLSSVQGGPLPVISSVITPLIP